MPSDIPHSAVPAARHSTCSILTSFAAACFIGALFTDLAYWRSAEMMWSDFSAWLVTVGVVAGCLAVVAGLIEYFAERRSPYYAPPAAIYVIGSLIALVLAVINMLMHTHDAWTSVMPWGLALSIAVVVVLLISSWLGNAKASE